MFCDKVYWIIKVYMPIIGCEAINRYIKIHLIRISVTSNTTTVPTGAYSFSFDIVSYVIRCFFFFQSRWLHPKQKTNSNIQFIIRLNDVDDVIRRSRKKKCSANIGNFLPRPRLHFKSIWRIDASVYHRKEPPTQLAKWKLRDSMCQLICSHWVRFKKWIIFAGVVVWNMVCVWVYVPQFN